MVLVFGGLRGFVGGLALALTIVGGRPRVDILVEGFRFGEIKTGLT